MSLKGLHWPHMHIDPLSASVPVLIECQRLQVAIRGRHDWQQRSGTRWHSIRAIETKENDNFTCCNLNFFPDGTDIGLIVYQPLTL